MADEETKTEEVVEENAAPTSEAVGVPTESVGKEVKEETKESSDEQPKTDVGVPTESVEKEKPEPTGKFADMIKQIEEMKVADLADLVKALEDRFGVSAAMPMAVAGAGTAAGAGEAVEEKSTYTVMLKDSGAQKIAVIKAVREINQELGLKEAKDLVDAAPKEIKKDIPKADAEEAKKKLEAAGATVELV